jgi:uncharacterized repeat protein (TIGR03803 family)
MRSSKHNMTLRRAGICAALIVAAGSASAAPTLTLLHSFTNGREYTAPEAGLIADTSGNLYGTTLGGGTGCEGDGCGTVFKLTPDGTLTLLHSFAGGASDGASPKAGLIADSSGNLYGTTDRGGGTGCEGDGCGTVFKLTPDGTLTLLHSFAGGASDGAKPEAGLIADSSGNLYGTTVRGGGTGCEGYGCGTVFKLTPGGTLTLLHSFAGGASDGALPQAGLLADKSGNLYGTTAVGGPVDGGTVFKLAPDGTLTLLHSFMGGGDGREPLAGLLGDSSGNLYGTTWGGGVSKEGGPSNDGTVFKLAPDGTLTRLHSFFSPRDGAAPFAGLIADSSGNLYGTTRAGDASNGGTVFKLAPDGTLTVLHSFMQGLSDGAHPKAGLLADKSGNLYGTTRVGGAAYQGVVFKISGIGP